MLHDPMRAQGRAFAVGLVLAIVGLAGCAVYGLIRPQGAVGDAHIIAARSSGALYVMVDGTLHPALNLSSARLVTNSSESPKSVGDKKLRAYPRGPLLGIPGAPAALPGPADGDRSSWTVCDTVAGSSMSGAVDLAVLAARPLLSDRIRVAGADEAVLVRVPEADVAPDVDGERYYLLFGDRRARVDLADPVVRRSLRLEGRSPRPVSIGLLNAFREVPPIAVPEIDDRGAPTALRRPGVGVGSVVRVSGVGGNSEFYVVFADGVQRVGKLAAELVRSSDPAGATDVPAVAPAAVAGLPAVNHLAVQDFPPTAPKVATLDESVMCFGWERGNDRASGDGVLLLGRGLPLPSAATAVRPASADGPGPGVDQVYVPPGTGQYVQVTGSGPSSQRAESLFYVTDSGVRHGVFDIQAGKTLGLGARPSPVPWALVSLLPAGPSLSRAAALVSHDGIEPDASGTIFELPRQWN